MNTLKLRRIAIDTYHENVAYLNRECSIYRAEGFQALSKIEINANGKQIHAVLNVVDDTDIVACHELGLSEQAFDQVGLQAGDEITIAPAQPPHSMDAVRRKINGGKLSLENFRAIAEDIVDNRYSKMEIAAFLVATSQTEMDRDEVLDLTRAMYETGEKLDWHEPFVADKHCIGGIPGNRTSMLVIPIVAEHGMLIPKTSSRAITSPSGTADTMEVLADVDLAPEKLRHIVHKQRGCLAWGGTAKLAPVDDMLISVERPLGIDSRSQMVASILSKKLAAGSTHLLIDIPVGPTAKVRHMQEALSLRKLFEFVGDRLGLHLQVIITDGRQPIGRGIGPVLEARDVMQVLNNDPEAPADLRQKALRLAGRVLEFDPDVRGGAGFDLARDILDSGRALSRMEAIIAAQGKQQQTFSSGSLVQEILSPVSGHVIGIDNFQIAKIARLAGAPMDKGAGVDLLKKVGAPVTKGEPLYFIHAEFPTDFKFSIAMVTQGDGYTIGTYEKASQHYADF